MKYVGVDLHKHVIVLCVVVLAAGRPKVENVVFVRMAAKPLERLVETVRQIARGQLGAQAGLFKTRELEYLAGEVNSMSTSLAQIDQDRRQQMDKAHHIQEHLLPHDVSMPGLAVAHLHQPAVEIAGDNDVAESGVKCCQVACPSSCCAPATNSATRGTWLRTSLRDRELSGVVVAGIGDS